jgi:hypothetical protein
MDIYLADSTALYRYNAKAHALDLVRLGDIRALTGTGSYQAKAPVNLVFVHDERVFEKMGYTPEERSLFASAGAGVIAENVYIYCAGNNLNVGLRADIDRPALAKAMELVPEQKILLAQSVGYPPTMQVITSAIKNVFGRE